jgi:putative membrane protein
MFLRLLTKFLAVVFALLLAAYLIEGITVSGLYAALIAALFLGVINIVVRPILLLLTLPITLLSLGLFIFVLNALLLWFVASVVQGFEVTGFAAAFWGTLVVSLVSWVANRLMP